MNKKKKNIKEIVLTPEKIRIKLLQVLNVEYEAYGKIPCDYRELADALIEITNTKPMHKITQDDIHGR